jgi:hypothetical protein
MKVQREIAERRHGLVYRLYLPGKRGVGVLVAMTMPWGSAKACAILR